MGFSRSTRQNCRRNSLWLNIYCVFVHIGGQVPVQPPADRINMGNPEQQVLIPVVPVSRIRPQPGQLPPILRPAPPTLIPPAPPQPRPQPRPQPQAPQPPTRNAAGYLFSEGLTGRDLDSPFGRGTERGIDQLQMNVLVMYNRWENYILHVMAQYPRVDYATRNGPVYLRNLQTWQTQFNEQLETLRALHPASMTVRTFRDNTFRTIVEHFTVKVRRTQLELEEWSGVVVDQARRMGLRPENVSFDII